MALQHGGERLAGAGAARSHLDRSGHEFAHRHGLRVSATQRHLAQYVALRKYARHAKVAIDHRHGAYMVVQHLVNGIGHAGFERNRGNLPVTKFQHAHKHLPEVRNRTDPAPVRDTRRIDALCFWRSGCQVNLQDNIASPTWLAGQRLPIQESPDVAAEDFPILHHKLHALQRLDVA